MILLIAINNDNIWLVLLDAFDRRIEILVQSYNFDLGFLDQQGFNTFAK